MCDDILDRPSLAMRLDGIARDRSFARAAGTTYTSWHRD